MLDSEARFSTLYCARYAYRYEQVCTSMKQGSLVLTLCSQILTAAKTLHENGIVHRDIKPANIMCQTNVDLEQLQSSLSWDIGVPSLKMHCVLGDYSSAWDDYTRHHLYTRGPSRLEQTDEYAPPEAIFGYIYNVTSQPTISPSFDSWSIGIVALELLLGTPNVFSVDQRTRYVIPSAICHTHFSLHQLMRANAFPAALSFAEWSCRTKCKNKGRHHKKSKGPCIWPH
jgi:serine/threonine protein kinase